MQVFQLLRVKFLFIIDFGGQKSEKHFVFLIVMFGILVGSFIVKSNNDSAPTATEVVDGAKVAPITLI